MRQLTWHSIQSNTARPEWHPTFASAKDRSGRDYYHDLEACSIHQAFVAVSDASCANAPGGIRPSQPHTIITTHPTGLPKQTPRQGHREEMRQ
jgi:hypothetical protein